MPAVTTSRICPTRVVFDGQSLNIVPGYPDNFPAQLMAGRGVPYNNGVAIGSTSWTVLQFSAATRCYPLASKAQRSILVMTGGTKDLLNAASGGENNTGAQAYADFNTYATGARAAGFNIILVTTVTPAGGITGTQETERVNCNNLIKANSWGYDGVCDLAGDARLADITNATYYEQVTQTHYTAAGAAVAASIINPVLSLYIV